LASQPFTGTGKKLGTATWTATNQTAGPLCLSANDLRDSFCPDKMRQSITAKSRILTV